MRGDCGVKGAEFEVGAEGEGLDELAACAGVALGSKPRTAQRVLLEPVLFEPVL